MKVILPNCSFSFVQPTRMPHRECGGINGCSSFAMDTSPCLKSTGMVVLLDSNQLCSPCAISDPDQYCRKLQVPGTKVIPVPLFQVLDGKRSEDYCERVEPSPSGGKLIAQFFLEIIRHNGLIRGNTQQQQPAGNKQAAPVSQSMADRF
jgi:hypothetical protein